MGKWILLARRALGPEIPNGIRDQYQMFAATQVQRQGRLLFGALLLTTPAAIYGANPQAAAFVRVGIPLLVAIACLIGVIHTSRKSALPDNSQQARQILIQATVSSCLIAVGCSTWCVLSWYSATPQERIYFPIVIVLGTLATVYCLASLHLAAILNLMINVGPILVLLCGSDSRMDRMLAVSIMLTGAFQIHMTMSQQKYQINQLLLQMQMRNLARTDPLTGLANRRALLDFAETLGADGPLRLMLVDIDHFKSINDRFGHDAGDAVLCGVAAILGECNSDAMMVARIGGEEFAVLGLATDLPKAAALTLIANMRAAPMPHAITVTVSIGLADGMAPSESAWRALFNRADAALYEAKESGRNRIVEAAAETHEANRAIQKFEAAA